MKPFQLSPSEQRGYFFLFIGLIILLVVRSMPEQRTFYDVSVYMDKLPSKAGEFSMPMDSSALYHSKKSTQRTVTKTATRIPDFFDPNYLSARKMFGLHFPETWVDRILQYKREHGYIENEEDFRSMCAEDTAMYNRLRPHLRFRHEPRRRAVPSPVVETTDLNRAQMNDLKSIRGIGDVLAGRILKFRVALGGFHSEHQLYEVYGLDSLVVSRLRDKFEVRGEIGRININKASVSQLHAHPYISHHMAKTLVKYRENYGAFSDVKELHQLYSWKSEQIEKVRPYLTLGDQPGL